MGYINDSEKQSEKNNSSDDEVVSPASIGIQKKEKKRKQKSDKESFGKDNQLVKCSR